jgi:hypothetical protein
VGLQIGFFCKNPEILELLCSEEVDFVQRLDQLLILSQLLAPVQKHR